MATKARGLEYTPQPRMIFRTSAVLLCALLCACVSTGARTTLVGERASQQQFLRGADLSALGVMEAKGARFRDKEGPGDALGLLRKAGANCIRLRLFVDPNGEEMVTNSLDYTLALARRVKASGADFMLDIHYSDTWADPSKQFKPAAWAKLSEEELVGAVREYSRMVLERFSDAGLRPDYVQIGNEITNGMLWPTGRAEFGTATEKDGWVMLGRFLRAGAEGVKAACREGKQPKLILHVESTGNVPRSLWFFRNAVELSVPFDIIGLSYYPEWHGTLNDLKQTADTLALEFKKPVMVVETAYSWKHDSHWDGAANQAFPATPAGQAEFLKAVRSVVEAVPGGLGAGVIYWHPESIQHDGVNAWLGGSCALFDDEGVALPGTALFAPAK